MTTENKIAPSLLEKLSDLKHHPGICDRNTKWGIIVVNTQGITNCPEGAVRYEAGG